MNKVLFLSLLFLYKTTYAQSKEDSVVLHTSSGNLYGSFITPNSANQFDVVILQAGSGPTDRNGNSPLGVKANSYKMLSDSLIKYNIATLLIDKRGVAASKDAGKDESKLLFDDYIKDMVDWATLIKKDQRVQKIIFAGHSEGSLIAMVAAQQAKADKYISIAGASQPINEIISWQLKQRAPTLAATADSIFEKMKKEETVETIPPTLLSLFRPSIQPYMISWMKYNPCTEIKKLTIPVLVVQGTTDIQVQQSEAEALHTCNPYTTLSIINGMNHVLKSSSSDMTANMATYADATLPLPTQLVTEIVNFIKK